MNYTKKTFSVYVGSDKYRDNYEATFRNKEEPAKEEKVEETKEEKESVE